MKCGRRLTASHPRTLTKNSYHLRARHYEFSRLGVTDDALYADGTLRARVEVGVTICANDMREDEDKTTLPLEGKVGHLAWSPTDPRRLATVGGDDAPRSLRIWRLRNV